MDNGNKTSREQCSPHEADWYVGVIYSKTFCPCPGQCARGIRDHHERVYGTETGESYGYFKGDQPTLADRDAMMPEGAHRLESTVTRIKRDRVAKPLSGEALTKIIRDNLGYDRANMPVSGGFAVTKVLWEMVPVYLVHWAYKEDNMRERALTEEVRAMRDLLRSKGYLTQTTGNLFFVLPDRFASLAD